MDLPTELTYQVLLYLPLSDLFLKVALVHSELHHLTRSLNFIQIIVNRDICMTQRDLSKELCKYLLRICLIQSSQPLEFYGFATNGGIDEGAPQLWVRNMFEFGESGYSTKENAFNVNCAAVFDNSLRLSSLLNGSIEFLRRLEQSMQLPPQTVGSLADVFHALFSLRLVFNEPNPLFPEYIRCIQAIHEYLSPDVSTLTKSIGNVLFLEERIDFALVEASPNYCCLQGVKISRAGAYTCPISTLILYCSDTYIPVNSPEFDKYNDLRAPEQVKLAHDVDPTFPDIGMTVLTANHSYLEFKSCSGPLIPVLWLQFRPDRFEEAVVKFSRRFVCKFIYVKLIDCENRREAQRWMHDNMNIDIRHVLALGTSLTLT